MAGEASVSPLYRSDILISTLPAGCLSGIQTRNLDISLCCAAWKGRTQTQIECRLKRRIRGEVWIRRRRIQAEGALGFWPSKNTDA